ncbi:DNA polymerase-3 subunit delta' [Peptoniphilus olsenii]|uniref:DNA polymerase III subunit delta' n=1 Tax=Peptoniphilus olsenii TaxID=411570 RepID=A0ABV2J845_9FIRM
MFLENVEISNKLDKDFSQSSLSHAYLFYGPKGIGKFSHAKNFARAILTENPEQIRYFSGIDNYNSPDLDIIESDNTIKKAEIEELIEKSFSKPFNGKYKVVIINDFDKVTVEGQNALLKTLEEPMDYLILILITSNFEKILPTIISRCRILKFSEVDEARIEKLLLSKSVSEKNAKLFSRLAHGSVCLAIKYTENPELLQLREDLIEILDSLIRKSGYLFTKLDFFKDNKDKIIDIFNFFLIWYRDLFFVKSGVKDLVINLDKIELLELQDVSFEEAIAGYDSILRAIERLDKNINFDLNIEKLLIELGGVR